MANSHFLECYESISRRYTVSASAVRANYIDTMEHKMHILGGIQLDPSYVEPNFLQ